MRSVTPVILLICAAVATQAASSEYAAEPHLPIVPRTADEAARIDAVTAPPTDFSAPETFEENPAGAATVRARTTADAFSQSSGNIPFERELDFKVGNGLFKKLWVSSPSSTKASDGLGPVYNARSCQRCHVKDGRGKMPEDDGAGLFLRLSVPQSGPADSEIGRYLEALDGDVPRAMPHPVYGAQLQDHAVQGVPAEGQMTVRYEPREVALSGGDSVTLHDPVYGIEAPGYGPLGDTTMISPRLAPQMIGLGLLEAVPAADILANADPYDADGDGISGRAQIVWSHEFDRPMLGRFGWKAGNPTIREQAASAFAGDIGISSPLFTDGFGECTARQDACVTAPHGDGDARETEIDAEGLDLVTFYSRNLAVPARRDIDDPEVLRGKQVFHETGCASCHTPKFVTHRLEDQPEQSFQLIWPMTDMLLHDMGDGLADNRPELRATGREWRTAPLWGLGMTRQVSGAEHYLHDGRARSILEAVMWHGGEAEAAKTRVAEMPKPDRDALIRYLESL
ncbi:c-type cytochrome [Roseivivax marinus]|uniref:di-heme oxidoreductase family protein n=1 Tax=Roseivivax marinus TaxID=1379903 RepID=UPI001F0340AB|nr:di-heme oxidoredictase family protein [Roseivivax marinus]UMA64556.1 c-type cytochrome [Roseivivax marinus]